MNQSAQITVDAVSKRFGRNRLFHSLSFSLETGESIAITGSNGSGKSTLIKILMGLIVPDKGKVTSFINGAPLSREAALVHSGASMPEMNLYGYLTGEENLLFAQTDKNSQENDRLFNLFGLIVQKDKEVTLYSTGMKQKLKYITAVINRPPFIFLDEPTSNLDREGRRALFQHLETLRPSSIIVIATNSEEEGSFCSGSLSLE
jgi:heme exporter protein A